MHHIVHTQEEMLEIWWAGFLQKNAFFLVKTKSSFFLDNALSQNVNEFIERASQKNLRQHKKASLIIVWLIAVTKLFQKSFWKVWKYI